MTVTSVVPAANGDNVPVASTVMVSETRGLEQIYAIVRKRQRP